VNLNGCQNPTETGKKDKSLLVRRGEKGNVEGRAELSNSRTLGAVVALNELKRFVGGVRIKRGKEALRLNRKSFPVRIRRSYGKKKQKKNKKKKKKKMENRLGVRLHRGKTYSVWRREGGPEGRQQSKKKIFFRRKRIYGEKG